MEILFDDLKGAFRTLLVGVVAYVALVAILRYSGKRTLSKMNAFDLVVTVALGSTLATILLSDDTPLVEGLVAFLVLAGMQRVITEAALALVLPAPMSRLSISSVSTPASSRCSDTSAPVIPPPTTTASHATSRCKEG